MATTTVMINFPSFIQVAEALEQLKIEIWNLETTIFGTSFYKIADINLIFSENIR